MKYEQRYLSDRAASPRLCFCMCFLDRFHMRAKQHLPFSISLCATAAISFLHWADWIGTKSLFHQKSTVHLVAIGKRKARSV